MGVKPTAIQGLTWLADWCTQTGPSHPFNVVNITYRHMQHRFLYICKIEKLTYPPNSEATS